MILTAQNNSPETRAALLKEHNEYRDAQWKNVRPQVFTRTSFLEEPYWMQLKRNQDKALAEMREAAPQFRDLFAFADKYGLVYRKLDSYHHRIRNTKTGDFIDWWDGKKSRMRRIDGSFGIQGNSHIFLLQEIVILSRK